MVRSVFSAGYRQFRRILVEERKRAGMTQAALTIRGFSGVRLLVVDEAARVPDECAHQEATASIRGHSES